MKINLKIIFFLLFFISLNSIKEAQGYSFGILPNHINIPKIQALFHKFKTTYFINDCSPTELRIQSKALGHFTYSEEMGYGMIITAYSAANIHGPQIMQKLWNFVYHHLDSNGLMNWQTSCSSKLETHSATDGDLDIALALIEANHRWPQYHFGNDARFYLKNILRYDTNIYGLKPSDFSSEDNNPISPGYFAVGYFPVFACFTHNLTWLTLESKLYHQLNFWYHNYALPPDWIKPITGKHYFGNYRYRAYLTPWRLGLNYLWNGNVTAMKFCKKIVNNFIKNNPVPSSIGNNYNYLTGEQLSFTYAPQFEGLIGDAAMIQPQDRSWLDTEYQDLLKAHSRGCNSQALQIISLLVQSGLFKNPCPCNISTPTLSPTAIHLITPTVIPTLTPVRTSQPISKSQPLASLIITPTPTLTPHPHLRLPHPLTLVKSALSPKPTTSTISNHASVFTPTQTPTATVTPTPTSTATPTPTVALTISKIYPNPSHRIPIATIINVSCPSTIEWVIYTNAFIKVFEAQLPMTGQGFLVWNLYESNGQLAPNGVYYFYIKITNPYKIVEKIKRFVLKN
jgi:endo-1,4-beta-D-glucanase Y